MFGYIIVNKQEMKFKEFDLYKSYYCGFCQELRRRYGKSGQLTLSYDLTFLILLLTSLYEPETAEEHCRCIAHPFEKHPTRVNEFTGYAADMNLLLSYYKCEDDWHDEHKVTRKVFSDVLKRKVRRIREKYPKKAELVQDRLNRIHECEKADSDNVDETAGLFGEIMAEIFAARSDEWEAELRRIGFFMGKFIYLADAYEDVEKDKKEGNYNPFGRLYGTEEFEKVSGQVLTMMMAECSKAFEKLPLIEYTEILRNILYSGVWCRYEMVRNKRKRESVKAGDKDYV